MALEVNIFEFINLTSSSSNQSILHGCILCALQFSTMLIKIGRNL